MHCAPGWCNSDGSTRGGHLQHGVVLFDFKAKVWLFFSCARGIWSDTRGKVLSTARGLEKDAESAPCVHEGQRDDHARSARASDKIATFREISARVCGISDRSGLFSCEWVQKLAKTELVVPIY